MKTRITMAMAWVLTVISLGTARADVIFGNLPQISAGTASIASGLGGPLANSFSTGASGGQLTDVKLLLDASNPSDGGSFSVTLQADSSTSPGGFLDLIGTTSDSSLAGSLAPVDYLLASPFMLAPDTRYWIEASATSSSAKWSHATTNVGIGVAAEYNSYDGEVMPNSSLLPFQMQVNETTSGVPEPATNGMLLGAVAILALVLRRRFARI